MSGNPLPDLQPAEFEALKASIRDHGQLEPVVVSAGPACAGEIGDGHHRQRACAELGIECERQPRRFATEVEFRLYQVETNVKRRQLTVGQRIQVARDLIEPLERELAAQRKRAHGGTAPGRRANTPGKATGSEAAGDSRDRTAAAVGVSGRTYERGAKVLEEGSDRLRDQFLAGDVTVNSAFMRLKGEQRPEPPPPSPLPAGVYDLILADPPWRYDHQRTPARRDVENHYPTMASGELKALAIPAAADSALFMWATPPKAAEALALIDAWGFEYVTQAVWVKDRIGMGYWFRQRHELLLVARRGSLSPPEPAARPDSVIEAPRGRHSAKPAAVYQLLERMFPHATRLELFARGGRPGWDTWGNEAA